jgi:hypothetical protein
MSNAAKVEFIQESKTPSVNFKMSQKISFKITKKMVSKDSKPDSV